jgi:hypothetical protein
VFEGVNVFAKNLENRHHLLLGFKKGKENSKKKI